VTETPDASGFPRPASFAIASPDSHLLDLAGMLGAYSSLYALTDHANQQTGGSQPAMAYFDGDPFADDDQLPNGQPTTHDRMLAIMRVLVVNMERLHRDPSSGLPVDDVAMAGGKIARGTTLSTDVAAYTLLALRTARRTVDSELVLYSNTTPDSEGAPCLMDALPLIQGRAYSAELNSLVASLAAAFYDGFTDATGKAYLGWNRVLLRPRPHLPDDGGGYTDPRDVHAATLRASAGCAA
jgi:hypothetical protein